MRFFSIYSRILIFVCIGNVQLISAQDKLWTVVNKKIVFTIRNAKLPVQGSFTGIMAKVLFDPTELKSSSFLASVTASTIKTGIEMRDRHLKRAEYFDVLKYPEINLKSKSITLVKDNNYIAKCILTMKGVSKEIDLPFSFIKNGNSAVFKGSLSLNRLDFGLGSSSIIMANQLQVEIEINAVSN